MDEEDQISLNEDEIHETSAAYQHLSNMKKMMANRGLDTPFWNVNKKAYKSQNPQMKDKEFYKAMQKIKDKHTSKKPPKKPASAYILFQKDVSKIVKFDLGFRNELRFCWEIPKQRWLRLSRR